MVKGGSNTRTGENIHKRSDGRWEARYIVSYNADGKAKYKSLYAKTYSEVKAKLKQATAFNNKNNSFSSHTIELPQVAIAWLESRRLYIKESTYAKYYDDVFNHIVPYFLKTKIQKLTQTIIDEYIQYLLTAGSKKRKALSIKSVKDIINVLKQILKYAYKKEYIKATYEFDLPKQSKKEIRILSQEEQNRLINYIIFHLNFETFGFLLTLFTGLRIGELCALKITDFNFMNNTFTINKTLQRIKNTDINSKQRTKIIITEPKSENSIRTIPIPLFLKDILSSFKFTQDSYILTGTRRFIEPRTCENKFKRILQETKIDNINFHALRHTFATEFYKREKDIKSLSELLGHSDTGITLKTYIHSNMELKKSYMENLKPCI